MFPFVHSELPKVTLYKSDWKSTYTGFCRNVFNRDGSCCDPESLEAYSNAWVKRLDVKLDQTLEILPSFRVAIQSISEIRKFVKAKKDDILKAKAKISEEQLKDFEENILPALSEGLFDFAGKETRMRVVAVKCKDYLQTLRKNAICMRCSGKGSLFWDAKDQKYLVKKSTCFGIIDNCIESFSYFSEVTTFMKRLSQIRVALKGEDIRTAHSKGMLRKDINFIKACELDLDYCKETKAIYEKVCSFVTLAHSNADLEGDQPTMIDGELTAIRINAGKDPSKNDLFDRILEDTPKPAPSWWGFLKVDDDKGADLIDGFPYTSLGINNHD